MFCPYEFEVLVDVLNVRSQPNKRAKRTTKLKKGDKGIIVEEIDGWGKLMSGSGWVYTKYIEDLDFRV